MPDKPKVEFGDEAISITLQFDKPAKGGVSQYGSWWIWGVEEDGIDKVLFTDENLQGMLESIPVEAGLPVAIQKGRKGLWKVWKMDGGDWEVVEATKAAEPADPSPTPPAPPSSGPPAKPQTPQKAAQSTSGGLSVGEAASVWADCYTRASKILLGRVTPLEEDADMPAIDCARQAATSIFIAVTNDRSSLPKGFQHAPDAAVQQVVEAVDGEVEGEPGEMQEDDQLPF